MNNVTLSGRVVAAPSLNETNDGVKVTTFLIACDRSRLNKDGKRETDFIPVVAWRGTAEFFVRNFKKNDYVSVTGRIKSKLRPMKDNPDKTFRDIEVEAEKIEFCGYRRPQSEV